MAKQIISDESFATGSQPVQITQVISCGSLNALPRSGTYDARGGHCYIIYWGSGYTAGVGTVAIYLQINGVTVNPTVTQAFSYFNIASSHHTMGPGFYDWGNPAAGTYTLGMVASSGLLNDAGFDSHCLLVIEIA